MPNFFAVGWVLHDDPAKTLHVGPPLFLRKEGVETGTLTLVPRSKEFVERFVQRWNKFAERGTHQVVEISELTFEIVKEIKKVHGRNFVMEIEKVSGRTAYV